MGREAIRKLAIALAVNRVGFGVGYLAAPGRVGSGWIGKPATDERTKVFTRALGARDLALAAGALRALLRRDDSASDWMAAQALADAVDLGASIAARDRLPESGFRFALGMAGVSTAVAAAGWAVTRRPSGNEARADAFEAALGQLRPDGERAAYSPGPRANPDADEETVRVGTEKFARVLGH